MDILLQLNSINRKIEIPQEFLHIINDNLKYYNIKLWNTLIGHDDPVYSVVISDNIIVSGSADNTIKIWK